MLCTIYKSTKKEGAYLYVAKRDDFSAIPTELMQMFGKPVLVMTLNIATRELALVDVKTVKESIIEKGFFLQLSPPPENLLEEYKAHKQQQQ